MISFNNIGNLGRLANQMFQYASLKGIAKNRGYDFSIPPQQVFGQNDDLVRNSPLNIYTVFENISKNNIQISRNPILQERMHEFDEELFRSCPDNVDLFGYYQSPKYFEHINDEIKNDFKFSDDVEAVCNEMYESINDGKKVISLHIRRTDYTVNNNHPLQPIEYYQNALTFFDKTDRLIVFSDDPKWCQKQGMFSDDSILISEGNDADIDLCLMTKCDYHIIANSSFSWWGAWLSKSKDVIAPSKWFGPDKQHLETKDLYCEDWTII